MKEVVIGLLLSAIFYVYFQKQRFIEINKKDINSETSDLATINIYKIDEN